MFRSVSNRANTTINGLVILMHFALTWFNRTAVLVIILRPFQPLISHLWEILETRMIYLFNGPSFKQQSLLIWEALLFKFKAAKNLPDRYLSFKVLFQRNKCFRPRNSINCLKIGINNFHQVLIGFGLNLNKNCICTSGMMTFHNLENLTQLFQYFFVVAGFFEINPHIGSCIIT